MIIAQFMFAAILLVLAALLTRDLGNAAAVRLEVAVAIMIVGGLLLLAYARGLF